MYLKTGSSGSTNYAVSIYARRMVEGPALTGSVSEKKLRDESDSVPSLDSLPFTVDDDPETQRKRLNLGEK